MLSIRMAASHILSTNDIEAVAISILQNVVIVIV